MNFYPILITNYFLKTFTICEISIKYPELRTADKDIIVYKYVNFKTIKIFGWTIYEKAVSLIYRFSYRKNKVYTVILSKPYYISEQEYRYESSTGFYSYTSESKSEIDAKFIIPKGAKYYIWDSFGDKVYVSDKIKYIGRI